jgi:hypothetical protein
MKKALLVLGLLLLGLAAYLALWPVPIEPLSWKAPAAPGYVGPHEANQKLADLPAEDRLLETRKIMHKDLHRH